MPEITTPEQEWVQEPDLIKATYSSLTLHRKCPQAWYYRYGLGLRQPVTGPAPQLRYGSWWGALMGADALERGRRFDSLVVPPRRWTPVDGGPTFDQKTVTTTEIILAARDWWNAQDDITKEVSLEKMGAPVANRIRDAFVRYRDEYGKQLEYERPLGLEVFWERPLPRPAEDGAWENSADLLQLEGLPEIRLFGYVDQVMFDTSRGMITVKDDKFLSSLGNMTAVDDMMDSQLDLYAWGVERTLQRYDINERVRAVMFDRVKSTAPSTPKLNLNGSLSASVTQFDLKTYLDWAREDTRPGPFPTYGPDGWTPGPVFGVEQEVWDKLTEEQRDMVHDLGAGRVWGKIGEFGKTGKLAGLPKFGIYQPDDKVIERISAPQWKHQFMNRSQRPVSRNIVRAHLRAAIDTATDIWRTEKRVGITNEAARNLTKSNCQWCDYQKICHAQMVGGSDGDYDLTEMGLVARDGRKELLGSIR